MSNYTSKLNTEHKRSIGFTLIELSIVLVIISLIVGGVLVAQDLIHAAKIRSSTSQLREYSTALNTFKLKYNCIPGDCASAVKLGLHQDDEGNYTVCSNHIGNGNKILNDGNHGGIIYFNGEYAFFWGHLRGARLVEDVKKNWGATEACGTGTIQAEQNYPASRGVGESVIAVMHEGYIYLVVGGFPKDKAIAAMSYPYTSSHTIAHRQLTPLEAKQIDELMDDGNPTTGNVFAIQQYAGFSAGTLIKDADGSGTNCIDGSDYKVTDENKRCTLAIKAM